MKWTKRLISFSLALMMVLGMLPWIAGSASAVEMPETVGLNVAYHTQEEVQAFLDANPASMQQPVTYAQEPSLSEPYSPGVLSDETLESALNMLNRCRYIAGLDANVTLNDNYSVLASAATLLNWLNDTLSHYPVRPSVLEDSAYDDLYQTGYTGAGQSNLAWGYSVINRDMIQGWMADADSSNIAALGHRRWILNPAMQQTGFGMTERYSAMYSIDRTGSGGQTYVAWPAQTMPVQYFSADYPWSVSTGYMVDAAGVQVTLVRESKGDTCRQTWTFTSSEADGDFYVNNGGYGQVGCIIFRPDDLDTISDGDVFDVTISLDYGATVVSYSVTFFEAALTQVDGGTCGENLNWTLDDSGRLTISGTGAMDNFSYNNAPWAAYKTVIDSVIIEDGVTSVGEYAFWNYYNMTHVEIADSVTSIGNSAFAYCFDLTSAVIPAGVTSIGSLAFNGCSALTIHGYAGTAAETYAEINGFAFAPVITHDWDQGVITKAAACEEDGNITYTCTICGETKIEDIPATGHYFADGSCTVCGAADPDYVSGVTLSGTLKSWEPEDGAGYLLYDAALTDAEIRADLAQDSPQQALYTGTGAAAVPGSGTSYEQVFTLEGIVPGTYKLAVYKSAKYVPQIVTVTVENTDVAIGELTLCLFGDVNGDGKVNGKDGILLAQYLAEWNVTINLDAADVNGDGKVNGKDGVLLAQYLAEWDVVLG